VKDNKNAGKRKTKNLWETIFNPERGGMYEGRKMLTNIGVKWNRSREN
jgi:hypothetical protein